MCSDRVLIMCLLCFFFLFLKLIKFWLQHFYGLLKKAYQILLSGHNTHPQDCTLSVYSCILTDSPDHMKGNDKHLHSFVQCIRCHNLKKYKLRDYMLFEMYYIWYCKINVSLLTYAFSFLIIPLESITTYYRPCLSLSK